MNLLLLLFLLSTGVILYCYRPKWTLLFWLLWEPIVLPLWCMLFMVINREEFYTNVETIRNSSRLFFLILLLLTIGERKCFPKIRRSYFALLLLIFFFLFQSIICSLSLHRIWANTSEICSLSLSLFLLSVNHKIVPDISSATKLLGFIVVLQLIVSFSNIFGYYAYLTFYIPFDFVTETGDVVAGFDDSLVMGTFPRFNELANFLTTIYLFFCIRYFFCEAYSMSKFYLWSIIILFIVVITGARMSILMFVFTYGICCLIKRKTHKLELFFSFILLVLFLTFFIVLSNKILDYSSIEGLNRVMEGFLSFWNSEKGSTNSTFDLSIYLIDQYFETGMLFGNGYADKGVLAYGTLGVVSLNNFVADARIAYLIVEYGIIGFSLYMFTFYSFFLDVGIRKNIKVSRIILYVCFSYYFLLSLTEAGFFDRIFLPYMFIFIVTCFNKYHRLQRR